MFNIFSKPKTEVFEVKQVYQMADNAVLEYELLHEKLLKESNREELQKQGVVFYGQWIINL